MKIIEKFEIEYVIPETDQEINDIQETIKDFEGDKIRDIEFGNLKLVDNRNSLANGFWRSLSKR